MGSHVETATKQERAESGKEMGRALRPASDTLSDPLQKKSAAPDPLAASEMSGPKIASPSGGTKIPEKIRTQMEESFGASFDDVRISEGADVSDMKAHAWTRGDHIRFAPGRLDFSSASGKALLGHELTHVMQQRAGKVAPDVKGSPLNVDAGHEGEANRLGARAAMGESVAGVFGSAGGGSLGNDAAAPVQAFGDHGAMVDDDLLKNGLQAGEGGTANRVDKVSYNRNIGHSKTNKGFFKPDAQKYEHFPDGTKGIVKDMMGTGPTQAIAPANDYKFNSSARAVASSRLDKKLGFGVLAEEKFAKHGEEVGSVSAVVKGAPTFKNIFEGARVSDDIGEEKPNEYKKDDDDNYRGISDTEFQTIDFTGKKGARAQKKMANLQLLDTLTGQMDRHGGNIFHDKETGDIKGIDNDLAFGANNARSVNLLGAEATNDTAKELKKSAYIEDRQLGKMQMPSMIDHKAAQKIMSLKADDLEKLLKGKDKDLTHMDDKEIQTARDRLAVLKNHITDLQEKGGLIKKWDDSTLEQAKGLGKNDNYIARHLSMKQDADAERPAKLAAAADARLAEMSPALNPNPAPAFVAAKAPTTAPARGLLGQGRSPSPPPNPAPVAKATPWTGAFPQPYKTKK